MRKNISHLLLTTAFFAITLDSFSQDPPPNDVNSNSLSGNATAASRVASIPVNYYTGIPNISIPLYNYSHHNGIGVNISLDYIGAGGIKVNETPSPAGLGWYLQAGGVVTRTVRGMPDDIPTNGFLYSSAIPLDYRPNGSKYYHDSLDAEQDIFQFNINGRSGKFFIGKNKQIVLVPLSKLHVSYITTGGNNTPIASFVIVAEDGVKYVFSDAEVQQVWITDFKCGYNQTNYNSAWYLSQIISPMGTDTIRFIYNTKSETGSAVAFPQTVYIQNTNHAQYRRFTPLGSQSTTTKKIASIIFPDKKKVQFLYDPLLSYDTKDSLLDRIKISDSIFRFGYVFTWQANSRSVLSGLQFYTPTATRPGYTFYYNSGFPAFGSPGDTLGAKRDHWGFYNAANNGTNVVPTVSGVYTGANRNATGNMGIGLLSQINDPSNGITNYTFEPNDIYSYNSVQQNVSINAITSTSTNISLSQVLSNQYNITLAFDNSFSRTGSPPFSGTCNLNISVTSLDGLTTYTTYSPTLYQLFYVGSASFSFTAPNGSYKLVTSIPSCSVTAGSLPINFMWQNQTSAGPATTMGGMRIKNVCHFDRTYGKYDTIATYKYIMPDGTSSGFLGTAPLYSYPYQETVINGSTTTTDYTAITSDPLNNLNYTQGSPVGYSRVIVYKGSYTHNLGNTVYEFTNLQDAGTNTYPPFFPYIPLTQPDWAMGLPKRVSTYDSLARLISVTRDTFAITTNNYISTDFTSLKLGKSSVTFNGDPNNVNTPYTEFYTGQNYTQTSGRADLTSSVDSLFHPDGSVQVNYQTFQYDTNYNIIKATATYDKTRGLLLEKRFYYPYNYTLASGAIKKLKDSSIISPLISTENWITGDANPRMISAQITDYQQLAQGHIKPLMAYALQSNAPVAQSVIGAFNPSSLVRNTTYLVPQQNFATYDNGGSVLEVKNVQSGQSNSVIMDYYNQFPIAKISNSAYNSVAYTSFESDRSGGWTIPGSARNGTWAITGKYSYDLASGNITKSGLTSTTTYLIYVWIKTGGSAIVNGTTLTNLVAQQNGGNLYSTSVTGITSITVSGNGTIDELRLHPKDANMATSTFEPLVGATSSNDANNTVTYYIYDALNRMRIVKDKDLNVLKKYEYDSITTSITTNPNWQPTGVTFCAGAGIVNRYEKDMNLFSDSYNIQRSVFDHNDCVACPPYCAGLDHKIINCVCELGTRVNASSVQMKVNNIWIWRCTYYYVWSDCSVSPNYTEDNATPCTVTTNPCVQ